MTVPSAAATPMSCRPWSAPFLRVRVDAVSADDRFCRDCQTDLGSDLTVEDGIAFLSPAKAISRASRCRWSPRSLRSRGRLDAPDRFLLRAIHRSPSPSPATHRRRVLGNVSCRSTGIPALPPDDLLLLRLATLTRGQVAARRRCRCSPGEEKSATCALWPQPGSGWRRFARLDLLSAVSAWFASSAVHCRGAAHTTLHARIVYGSADCDRKGQATCACLPGSHRPGKGCGGYPLGDKGTPSDPIALARPFDLNTPADPTAKSSSPQLDWPVPGGYPFVFETGTRRLRRTTRRTAHQLGRTLQRALRR